MDDNRISDHGHDRDLRRLSERRTLPGKCDDFVAVRPCNPKFEGKTYLGILIGEMTIADADIDNVSYVRALRALTKHSERPANTD